MLTKVGVIVVLLVAVASGCSSDSSTADDRRRAEATRVTGDITVSAAASLTEAFTRIGTGFTREHPDATATFNFGSSSTLATQVEQGAPSDTFASADAASMDDLVAGDLVRGTPAVFARNRLVIVTKIGNPESVERVADLADLDVVSLCGETVPCGVYAADVLAASEVTVPESKVTRGQDVKATLAAVTTGDADAAIVYATDAMSASVDTVFIPDANNVVASYPIATMQASGNPTTSRAFIRYVLSPAGQRTLRSFGFLPPR
jgi:molybdate transport system substrate-binding protein